MYLLSVNSLWYTTQICISSRIVGTLWFSVTFQSSLITHQHPISTVKLLDKALINRTTLITHRLRVNPNSLSYPFPLPLSLSFACSRERKGCPNSRFDRGVGLRGRGRYPSKPSIFASLLETKGYPEHTAARLSRESHKCKYFRLKKLI